MKLLFVNACVRAESRTKKLADYLLTKFDAKAKELNLAKMNLIPMNEDTLKKRFECIAKKDFSDPMFDLAKDFAEAEIILPCFLVVCVVIVVDIAVLIAENLLTFKECSYEIL